MFDLLFLGTAASVPSAERGLPSILVGAGSDRILIDCGEGTQRQMFRAGTGFRRLRRVLLTHAHLDHILGLPGLISTIGLMQKGGRIALHGGAGTLEAVRGLLGSTIGDGRPVELAWEPLDEARAIPGDGFAVRPFRVQHRETDSWGFLFETTPHKRLEPEKLKRLGVPDGPLRGRLAAGEPVEIGGRRIRPEDVAGLPKPALRLAITGDVGDPEALVDIIRGADALVTEATFLAEDEALARARGHLTAADAGRLAASAGVKQLLLTHISARYDPAQIAAEAAGHFPDVRVVRDLDRVSVP